MSRVKSVITDGGANVKISKGFIVLKKVLLLAFCSIPFAAFAQARGDGSNQSFRDILLGNFSSYSSYFTFQAANDLTIDRVYLSRDAEQRLANLRIQISFVPSRSGRVSPINAHLICSEGSSEIASGDLRFLNDWRVTDQERDLGTTDHPVNAGTSYSFDVIYEAPPELALDDLVSATCIIDAPIRLSRLDGVATASASFNVSDCNFGTSDEVLCTGTQLADRELWFRATSVYVSNGFVWSLVQNGHIAVNAVCHDAQPRCAYTVNDSEAENDLIAVTGRCLRGSGRENLVVYLDLNQPPPDRQDPQVLIDCS